MYALRNMSIKHATVTGQELIVIVGGITQLYPESSVKNTSKTRQKHLKNTSILPQNTCISYKEINSEYISN